MGRIGWGARGVAAALAVAGLFGAAGAARAEGKDEKKGAGSRILDWIDPRTTDREAAHKLAPVSLDKMAPGHASVDGQALRLRVYADEDYRGATMRWQKRVEHQLDRVNRVVEPSFG